MVAGNYINFAICEYYEDDVFTQLSKRFFEMIALCSIEDLRAYEKVHRQISIVTWHFFNHHMELLFLKFDL